MYHRRNVLNVIVAFLGQMCLGHHIIYDKSVDHEESLTKYIFINTRI